jgi:hypothetical protein
MARIRSIAVQSKPAAPSSAKIAAAQKKFINKTTACSDEALKHGKSILKSIAAIRCLKAEIEEKNTDAFYEPRVTIASFAAKMTEPKFKTPFPTTDTLDTMERAIQRFCDGFAKRK